ncbi:MAG TPA: CpsD/CapB family tyrosine-protein kinase [Acidobacteriaceae bacterium]|jgi:capsular exopolysaccharide synthesis family protein|nr:CpsD/CapB family tyrosine-protein kinase [Acidobacteriaceae bacterium]
MKYLVNALNMEQGISSVSTQDENISLDSDVYDQPVKQARTNEEPAIATISLPVRRADLSKLSQKVVSANNADMPNDIAAREQYRALRTKLTDTALPNGYKVIMVSSAAPGDGKSLTVLNLAFACSGVERLRVLLIEADLHRPSLHTLMGVTQEESAARHYTDAPEMWQSSLISLADNVDCLLAPMNYPRSAEFLESVALREMLAHARTKYDLILIDSPPMLATADALILVRYCDASLFVVDAGSTPIKAIKQATELMAGKLFGCILNRVQKVESDNYYQAYYKK